jgi:hypothetical protein
MHIQPFHSQGSFLPSCDELSCFVVEKQPLMQFFPSKASSPYCYGYLEEVAP